MKITTHPATKFQATPPAPSTNTGSTFERASLLVLIAEGVDSLRCVGCDETKLLAEFDAALKDGRVFATQYCRDCRDALAAFDVRKRQYWRNVAEGLRA